MDGVMLPFVHLPPKGMLRALFFCSSAGFWDLFLGRIGYLGLGVYTIQEDWVDWDFVLGWEYGTTTT